jgi:hypothetical protein
MFEPAPPKNLRTMTVDELQAALTVAEDKIKNNEKGVVPPHLRKGTTARLLKEKADIEAEITSRVPASGKVF